MMTLRLLVVLAALSGALSAKSVDDLLRTGAEAETRLETRKALESYLEADRLKPNDADILRKIARQYSDSGVDVRELAEKKKFAEQALSYAERAAKLDPKNAEGQLSLAVCHGKLAIYSDNRTKVAYSRLVREEAERALALDPNYDWAHHVLGRWHYEVAGLGGTTRFFVKLVYGGLPDASRAEAIAHLQKAIALAPDRLAHHLELGFALLADGREKEARAAFERGLALPSREKHDETAKARATRALSRLRTAT